MKSDPSPVRKHKRAARDPREESLFAELSLALGWNRPSILIAVYDLPSARKKAARRLARRLSKSGVRVAEIQITEPCADILLALRDHPGRDQTVFMVSGFTPVDGQAAVRAFKSLNMRREILVDQKLRVIFWLTEAEVIALARAAPDFWAFRHRVVDLLSTPARLTGEAGFEARLAAFEQPAAQSSTSLDARIAYREGRLDSLDASDWAARFDLHLGLSRLHAEKNEPEHALQHIQAAHELARAAGDTMRQCMAQAGHAILLVAAGSLDSALAAFERARALDPNQPGVIMRLSALHSTLGQSGQAVELARFCVARWPQFQPGWRQLGWLLGNAGQLQDALNACNHAVSLHPSDGRAHYTLGVVQSCSGDSHAAAASLLRAIKLDAMSGAFWQALASVFIDLGQPRRALRCARRAVRLSAQDAWAWLSLGGALYHHGRWRDSWRACERAFALGMQNEMAHVIAAASLHWLAQTRHQLAESAHWRTQAAAGLRTGSVLARDFHLASIGDSTAAREALSRLQSTACLDVHLLRHTPAMLLACNPA